MRGVFALSEAHEPGRSNFSCCNTEQKYERAGDTCSDVHFGEAVGDARRSGVSDFGVVGKVDSVLNV